MAVVDVVVVSYNSREKLRDCVAPLVGIDDLHVIVVDNNSADGSLASVANLPIQAIQTGRNGGFGSGCNVGWRSGESPFVLFLNPDAHISLTAIEVLREEVARPGVGISAPRIVAASGALEWSLRRYPSVVSMFGQALFAHRLFPKARWADEVIRDTAAYERRGAHDWASGACLMTRRDLLVRLGGFDEGFFLYCEEIDLCRRVAATGASIVFVPGAVCVHEGGASAPRPALLPVLSVSRLRYARKWLGTFGSLAYALGLLLNAFTHALVARDRATRRGHRLAIGAAARSFATQLRRREKL